MSEKFLNKYRIPSARASWWDYSIDATYFITICTAGRQNYFGHIRTIPDVYMELSEIGKMVESEWLKTPSIRPDMNLSLDAFMIMPNHFHAIIHIGKNQYNHRDAVQGVSTAASPHDDSSARYGSQNKNLSSIIRGFKSAVTTSAHLILSEFAWQTRYWDRIIRDDEEYQHIRSYIHNNPVNWNQDSLNPNSK
jgi:putative transposase